MIRNLEYLLGLPKSLYLSWRLCRWQDAWRLPIIASRKVRWSSLSGEVRLQRVRTGIMRIGFGSVETIDYRSQYTLLHLKGVVEVAGKCKIGYGSRISVDRGALLQLGESFHCSAAATIICRQQIRFGARCLLAWQSLITDSDLHPIYAVESDERINADRAVLIGEHCWIGARSTLLKGTQLADDSIVGAAAVVSGQFAESGVVLAGNPAQIVKRGVRWQE